MDNKLYIDYANYYAAVTDDRDFAGQLDCILEEYSTEHPCRSLLELFAGQALHSIEAIKRDQMEVWAIDSSKGMKDLALEIGFKKPDHYLVGNLPQAILAYEGDIKFDCILCLYHGLSNLNMTEVYETLHHIKNILSTEGKVFIELHNIFKIMEYIANPIIHSNELKDANGVLVKYAWPSGQIKWKSDSYKAEVPIKISVESSEGTETTEFTSHDHIYSAEHIIFLANLLGYKSRILPIEGMWKENFENSVILELSIKA